MKKILMLAVAAMTLALAGCGGGGGSPGSTAAANPAIAGFYTGPTNTGRTFNALVDQFAGAFVFYSQPGAPGALGGVLASTSGFVNGNTFMDNIVDVRVEPPAGSTAGTIVATVVPSTSASGTVSFAGGTTETFNITRNLTSTATASLTAIAGSYSGTTVVATGTATGTVSIALNGNITGSVPGCNYSGTATPRSDLNAFNISITYLTGCPSLDTIGGAAFYDSGANRLYAAAINPFGSRYIFVGGPRVP